MSETVNEPTRPLGQADTVATLREALDVLRSKIRDNPLANPVREMSHTLSRDLEAGRMTLGDVSGLVEHLDKQAFASRASHIHRYLDHPWKGTNQEPFRQVVEELSAPLSTVEEFQAFWSKRQETLVFTGHPTFLLSRKSREELAELAPDGAVPVSPAGVPDQKITLDWEHEQAEEALRNAADAVHRLTRTILEVARERFPDEWRQVMPDPIGLATWVGYDMDGRTDIGWQSVIRHRLEEKVMRLEIYLSRLKALGAPVTKVTARLRAGLNAAKAHATAFAGDMTDGDALSEAANSLTGYKDNLVDLDDVIAELGDLLQNHRRETALDIAAVRAEMAAFALAMGEVHFRLNASQIRHAAQGILGVAKEEDLFGRAALSRLSDKIAALETEQVNFGSLAAERSTSARLFIAMAQIAKHVDAKSPIRLLIAECENPLTVLAAIYQAKRFGVDHLVDACPLFETATSLSRSRRILDVLFAEEAYRTQALARGRVAIEAGFSDAGRFMGQVPACLAIERLQGQLADAMKAADLTEATAIIYDTHGESMGRGGHPGGIIDRCLYPHSAWTRQKFANKGITLRREQSFQGGDGYVWFTNPKIACLTLSGVLGSWLAAEEEAKVDDPFYHLTSASLDFYASVKRRQESLFRDPAYNIAMSAIGLPMLPQTGSRKSRRQFERSADEEHSLRRIRAIPHNGVLQQMGFLANILGGVGEAMAVEPSAFAQLREESPRFDRVMRLVDRARQGSDMKTLLAYMNLYSGSFWATRPISGEEPDLEGACATLAAHLANDARYFAGLQLAARLRSDSILLSQMLARMGFDAEKMSGHTDTSLDLLHVLRLVLLQHLFLIVAEMPTFTPSGTFSRAEAMDAILSLDLERGIQALKDAFPDTAPGVRSAKFDEAATYPSADEAAIDHEAPMRLSEIKEISTLIERISVAIANHFAAVG